MTVPTLTLNNGVQFPTLGFGVFQTPPMETAAAVTTALEQLVDQARGQVVPERDAARGVRRDVGAGSAASWCSVLRDALSGGRDRPIHRRQF